ncbi:MAG: hypothetical protein QXJ22_05775 [Ignisphaera sp.]|uniref:Sodium:solute symporter family protein n=1 Tax=Ignisphaera aggregans TaxID=334771 RepID=A0A7J3JQV1_9CREN
MLFTLAVIAIYLAIMISIGIAAMSRIKTVEDLYVGGMRIGGIVTALSFFTTYFSSVVFIGATALGWKYGLPILWKDVFVVLVGTLAAFIVLGPRFMILSRRLGFKSVIEFIEKRYSSRLAGLTAATVMLAGLFIYCLSIMVGVARAIEVVMKVDYVIALVATTVVTLIYTAFGGYLGQVWTQAVQAIIMILMAIAICVVSLIHTDGLPGLYQALKSIDPSLSEWPYRDFVPLFLLYVSLGLLGWGNPALIMRFISIRNRISFRSATVVAVATTVALTLSLNLASAASRVILPDVSKPDYAFTYLVQKLFPQGFDALFLVSVLSASMSTLAAIMGTMTHLLRDIVGSKTRFSRRGEFVFYRVATVAIASIATAVALQPPQMVMVLFGITTAILSGVLVGPIIYGLFWKRVTAPAVTIAMVASFISAIAVSAYGNFGFPWTYYAFAPTLALSLVLPPIVSLFTEPPPREIIDRTFSRC